MSITLTEPAVLAIKSALHERGKGIGMRVQANRGGASGLSFRLEFADLLTESDVCFAQANVRGVTDVQNLAYVTGQVLDYGVLGDNEGFSVRHAQPCDTCGCASG